jgi:acetyl esterase
MALVTGCNVLSVDYRRAPEHKFPAALMDCRTAWLWLTEGEGRAVGPGHHFLCGDSVGAALALATARYATTQNRGRPSGFIGLYGVYSPFSPDQIDGLEGPHVVTNERMNWFREQYEVVVGVDRFHPDFSPLQGRLDGLPRLFVAAAEADSFHLDSVRLAQSGVDAGVETHFHLYQGVVHGFMRMSGAVAEAKAAFRDIAGFVANAIRHDR